MKYMTKEWYNEFQNLFIPIEFSILPEACTYSEQIFNLQYNTSLNDYLEFTECYPTKVKAREMFEIRYNDNLEKLEEYFSKEIMDNIADKRLLALGKVTEENYIKIKDYIKQKQDSHKDILKKYEIEYKKIKHRIPRNVDENLNLHDCLITNIIKKDNKLIIEVDSSASFVDIKAITFEEYEIIEEEMDFKNAWWLYEEIYITDNKYEIHALIDSSKNNKNNLGYFIIKAKNIIFR